MSLSVRGVSHSYRTGGQVLSGVSFKVEPGTAVALMGPSGSGKTTLLSIIGGLFDPSEGSVDFGPDSTEEGRAVAWVFQTTNLLPRRTVRDNVAFGLLQNGLTLKQTRGPAERTLGLVGLEGHATRRAGSLSGGEAQRAGIARALLSGAPWLLADEPTGQLDQSTSLSVAGVLRRATEAGTGVVVATHDRTIAEVCDRVMHLVDGHLVENR
ncbi:MAG: ATP-binding cassette domain-containing protein [Actinomycetota bacterium]